MASSGSSSQLSLGIFDYHCWGGGGGRGLATPGVVSFPSASLPPPVATSASFTPFPSPAPFFLPPSVPIPSPYPSFPTPSPAPAPPSPALPPLSSLLRLYPPSFNSFFFLFFFFHSFVSAFCSCSGSFIHSLFRSSFRFLWCSFCLFIFFRFVGFFFYGSFLVSSSCGDLLGSFSCLVVGSCSLGFFPYCSFASFLLFFFLVFFSLPLHLFLLLLLLSLLLRLLLPLLT